MTPGADSESDSQQQLPRLDRPMQCRYLSNLVSLLLTSPESKIRPDLFRYRGETIAVPDVAIDDPLIERMLPAIDLESAFFWSSGRDGRLRFKRCQSCGCYSHPPSPRCRRCLSSRLLAAPVSGVATVLSYTINVQQWIAGQEPYVIAIVEIDEQTGLRLTTNIVDCAPDTVAVGQRVQVTFLPRNGIWYPLFRPLAPADGEREAPRPS